MVVWVVFSGCEAGRKGEEAELVYIVRSHTRTLSVPYVQATSMGVAWSNTVKGMLLDMDAFYVV